jgi:hypothetical protein
VLLTLLKVCGQPLWAVTSPLDLGRGHHHFIAPPPSRPLEAANTSVLAGLSWLVCGLGCRGAARAWVLADSLVCYRFIYRRFSRQEPLEALTTVIQEIWGKGLRFNGCNGSGRGGVAGGIDRGGTVDLAEVGAGCLYAV